jgi:hypothetical protein
MAQVVGHLLGKCKALSSNPHPIKKKKKVPNKNLCSSKDISKMKKIHQLEKIFAKDISDQGFASRIYKSVNYTQDRQVTQKEA